MLQGKSAAVVLIRPGSPTGWGQELWCGRGAGPRVFGSADAEPPLEQVGRARRRWGPPSAVSASGARFAGRTSSPRCRATVLGVGAWVRRGRLPWLSYCRTVAVSGLRPALGVGCGNCGLTEGLRRCRNSVVAARIRGDPSIRGWSVDRTAFPIQAAILFGNFRFAIRSSSGGGGLGGRADGRNCRSAGSPAGPGRSLRVSVVLLQAVSMPSSAVFFRCRRCVEVTTGLPDFAGTGPSRRDHGRSGVDFNGVNAHNRHNDVGAPVRSGAMIAQGRVVHRCQRRHVWGTFARRRCSPFRPGPLAFEHADPSTSRILGCPPSFPGLPVASARSSPGSDRLGPSLPITLSVRGCEIDCIASTTTDGCTLLGRWSRCAAAAVDLPLGGDSTLGVPGRPRRGTTS